MLNVIEEQWILKRLCLLSSFRFAQVFMIVGIAIELMSVSFFADLGFAGAKSCLGVPEGDEQMSSQYPKENVVVRIVPSSAASAKGVSLAVMGKTIQVQPRPQEFYGVVSVESFYEPTPKSKPYRDATRSGSVLLSEIPRQYQILAQSFYDRNAEKLKSKYPTYQHYLFSLCAESVLVFRRASLDEVRISHQSLLEMATVLEGLDHQMIHQSVERTLDGRWFIDQAGTLWDVIVPGDEVCIESDSLQTLDDDPLYHSIQVRVTEFLSTDVKIMDSQVRKKVLINLATVPRGLRTIYLKSLNRKFKNSESSLIYYLKVSL